MFLTSGLYQALGKNLHFQLKRRETGKPEQKRQRKMKAVGKEEEEVNEGKRAGGSMKGSGGLLGRQKKDQRVGSQVLEEIIIIFSSWGENYNREVFMVHSWKGKLKGTISKNDSKTELVGETAEKSKEKWLLNGQAHCHLYQGMVVQN